MIGSDVYISPDKAKEIAEAGTLRDVIEDHVQLKAKGSAFIGDCRSCGMKNALNVTQGSKKLYKCFHCQDGGVFPLQYLTSQIKMEYRDAQIYIAEKYSIDLTELKIIKQKSTKSKKGTFRDQQLRASGIPNAAQTYSYRDGKGIEYPGLDRYVSGSVNHHGEIDVDQDDMVLVYRELNGEHTEYTTPKKKKAKLYRVRHKVPLDNSDNNGQPRKYSSPYGSGSSTWWPEYILNQYKSGANIPTFVITEGEKKSDKLCWHKIAAAGIMGIHNLAYESMPQEFGKIIERFNVINVVFLLDEDWLDITVKNGKSADNRPKTFFKAVLKFRRFFYSYVSQGIPLNIFFGSHKSNGKYKGADDLLAAHKGNENEIVDDFHKAINTVPHDGKHFQFFNITSESDYNIKKLWHIHSDMAFIEYHSEKLKELFEFKISGLKWRYNKEDEKFELSQKLMPYEQYWIEIKNKDGDLKGFNFDYIGAEEFFKNRGIGIYEKSDTDYSMVMIEDNVVKEITARFIQIYLLNFTKNLEGYNIRLLANKMKSGVTQYLSPNQLQLLLQLETNFKKPDKHSHTLIFNNGFVNVSQDKVEVCPTANFHYWKDQIIDYKFEKRDPIFELSRGESNWQFKPVGDWMKCDLFKFFFGSSCVYWRKLFVLTTFEDGTQKYVRKPGSEVENGVTADEIQETFDHIASKILATGYVMHDYFNVANMRAIVCMDLKESKSGSSEGGTGKSIWSTMFEYLVPLIKIPSSRRNLMEDRFIFEKVTEKTHVVVFDDCRADFDFNAIFSPITNGFESQRKNKESVNAGFKKVIVNLNGILKGEGGSFVRRQYNLGFTDYYNLHRTPEDEFGHLMFHDYNHEQWNITFNFIIQCIQCYLQYGLKFTIPKEKLNRRRLHQKLKEDFIEWADLKFDSTGHWLNNKVNKKYMFQDYLSDNPSSRSWMTARIFKEKVVVYAEYVGLDFNKIKKGERIKSNGKEYFCMSDQDYVDQNSKFLDSEPFN